MTDTELILADLFISKMTFNQPVNTYPFFSGLAKYIDSQKFDSKTYSELCQMTINYGSVTEIRKYLLDNDFITVTNVLNPSDTLTIKGKLAKDKGGIKEYEKWEEEETKKKRIEDFPKRKWFVYEPVKIIASIIITASVSGIGGYLLGKNDNSNSNQSNNQPPSLSMPPKDTGQYSPKISNDSSTSLKLKYIDSVPK